MAVTRVKGSKSQRVRVIAVFLVLLITYHLSLITLRPAHAQGIGGAANNLPVADKDAKPGDIVIQTDKGVVRSTKPFDPQMIGVIVEFPVISSGNRADGTKAVMSSGRALVNVTATHGEIKEGDLITSSDKAGVGQKATVAGYILGKALAAYSDTSKDGQIQVLINISNFSSSPNVTGALGAIFGALTVGFQNTQNFPLLLRYLLAALISLVTFLISSFSFVRFMRHGLEAIGRNPLAKKTIVSGMILNAVIVGVLTIAGFGIAVAIVAF